MKRFDEWNEIKKETQKDKAIVGFKNRDIFFIKMGENIGFEQNGKGDSFVRPIVIVKGFNRDIFFGIPLSTKVKDGKFYHEFKFNKNGKTVTNIALLSQMRLYSSKRLLNKIGMMGKNDFEIMKRKFKKLID